MSFYIPKNKNNEGKYSLYQDYSIDCVVKLRKTFRSIRLFYPVTHFIVYVTILTLS